MPEEFEKTELEKLEDALRAFYRDYGRRTPIKARHTEVMVEPRFFIGGKLNPEIERLIVIVYLSKVKMDDILRGRVIIAPDLISIKDENGEEIVKVTSKKIIEGIINEVTVLIGRELSRIERKDGEGAYVEGKDAYSFGDIKDALIQFMMDMEKNDSKNLLRDAAVLFLNGSKAQELTTQ